ncbi:MAG: hypothetical protein AAGA75_14020 [Cyanobacteria bacterium P01_E01_bin.6]
MVNRISHTSPDHRFSGSTLQYSRALGDSHHRLEKVMGDRLSVVYF